MQTDRDPMDEDRIEKITENGPEVRKDSESQKEPESQKESDPKKEPETQKKFKLDLRFRLMIIGIILVLIAGYFILGTVQLSEILLDELASQTNSMYAAAGRVNTYTEIQDDYDKYDVDFNRVYLDVFRLHIERNGYSSDELNKTEDILAGDGYCYYVDHNGNVHGTAGADRLGLDSMELENLCQKGSYTKKNNYYYAEACDNNGTIIIKWIEDPVQDLLNSTSMLTACQNEAIIIDNATYTVLEAQDASRIEVGDIINMFTLSNVQLKTSSKYSSYIFIIKGEKRVFLGSKFDLNNGTSLLAFCSVGDLLIKLYDRMSYANTLLLVYVILTVIYAVIAVKRTSGVVHFTKNIYVNRATSHIISLMVFGSLFLLLLTINIDLLNRYSSQNQNAVENLEYMNTSLEHQDQLRETVSSYYEEELADTADLAGWLLLYDRDIYASRGVEYVADLLNVQELTIFDSAGNSVFTNTGYEDYPLTKNEEDAEYKARDILMDKAKQVVEHDDNSPTYFAAVKRRDDGGLVFIRTSDDALTEITDVLTSEAVIRNADFNWAVKAFVDKNDSTTLYWLAPNSTEIEKYTNTLSEAAMRNGYAGFQKINGASYYINTKNIDDYVLISAADRSYIIGEFIQDHLLLIVEYLILSLIILVGTGLRRIYSQAAVAEEDHEIIDDSLISLDNNLKQMLGRLVLISMAVLAVTLLVEYQISNNSLLSYLINNEWEKGLNIFSISECWIVAFIAMVITKLLKALIRFVSENLGPGALTAGHLIISVSQVAVWIGAFVICLYQVGADPKALVAGVSVTSVVFGIGAQSTVSDIISGFALVLEGHVRIGDWVQVNGFRGVVTSLGIRTTKISLYGNTISVNNSSMNDVVNLSKEPSHIDIYFQVKYGTDVEEVGQIIEAGAERYMNDCHALISPPHFENVNELAASGVDIHIWCVCQEKDRLFVHNHVMRTTYELLMENNITIPFTTITIDNPEADESETENRA